MFHRSSPTHLPGRSFSLKEVVQVGLLVLPLLLLAGLAWRGLQVSRETTREEARRQIERGMREIERRFAEGLANVRSNAPVPRVYPVNLEPADASPAQDLWRTAGEMGSVEAMAALARLDAEHPDGVAQSGVPLRPLVAWRLLEIESDPAAMVPRVQALGRAAVETHASLLTPELLTRAREILAGREQSVEALEIWQQRWEREEQARAVIRRQENEMPGSALPLWIEDGRGEWWVEEVAGEQRGKRVVSAAALRGLAADIASKARAVLPSYAALQIAARDVSLVDSPTGEVMSRAVFEGFELTGILGFPEKLFAVQRQQTLWLAALLGCALVVELAAFWMMGRALRRESRLGVLKSNFVSSVSHELRAPIASMRLMAENLESGTVQEPQRRDEYHRLMAEECRRLSALIDNVLDFARIEQNRRFYQFAETDVAVLVRDALDLLQPRAVQRRQTLTLEAAPLDPPPICDGLAVRQAIINLLDNAIKFSPAGSAIVVRVRPRAGASWELSVTDEGPGIPREEHARIFERFYRLGDELRRETQGAGIGLSIVQHIAEGHGAKVELESQPGVGSCFTLVFPNVPPAAELKGES